MRSLSWGLGVVFLLTSGCRSQGAPPADQTQVEAAQASALDAKIQEAWSAQQVSPASDVDDLTYLRRVTLDLAGRVPTAQEVRAFQADQRGDKRARRVAELLDSDDHARHLARIWERVLMGHEVKNRLVDRAALRNWLEAKFKADAPWDEIVRGLISAEGQSSVGGRRGAFMYNEDPERAAEEQKSGVNGATNYTLRFMPNPGDLAGHASRSFLGVQIQCAQCHDHKWEKWTQADFRGFSAAFTRVNVRPVEREKGEIPILELESAEGPARRFLRKNPDVAELARTAPRALDGTALPSDEGSREALAAWMTGKDNPWFSKAIVNRVWADLLGEGMVHPVDDLGPSSSVVMPEVLDYLAEELEQKAFDLDWLYATIAASKAYGRAVGDKGGRASHFASASLRPMSSDQLLDSVFTAADVEALLAERAPERANALKALARRRTGFVFEDDSEANGPGYDATLQQVFFAMNGVLPVAATTVSRGTLLEKVLKAGNEDAAIEELYLRTLSRPPSETELARAKAFISAPRDADPPFTPSRARAKDKAKGVPPANAGIPPQALRSQADSDRERGFEDLFWALLNSSEFYFRR